MLARPRPLPRPTEMSAATPSTRERLLASAVQVFAEKGFARASTREICQRAGTNGASINYYFGDKASLYREVFRPPSHLTEVPRAFLGNRTSLHAGLEAFFRPLFSLAAEQGLTPQVHALWVREQVQPTGLVNERLDFFRPRHEQFCRFLARHCGAPRVDDAIHHLAFSIGGMVMILVMKRDFVDAFAPGLLQDERAAEATLERLTAQAAALVGAETTRRRTHGPDDPR